MAEKIDMLDEVTVVAFGTQKKESVLSSIATIKPSELQAPTSNLTTALAGRIAGMISYQRSGEPGQDNADFFIRGVTTFGYKKDPLILIDGIELTSRDLSRLQVDDIASFSIMKDATATALYGARGANGVILVTTKEGTEGKAKISARYELSVSSPTQKTEWSDPITYMHLQNEAVMTRDPLGIVMHSPQKIENTRLGLNPNVFPAVDWYNELFKPTTLNQRANLNISGGGNVARYYIAASVSKDEGSLKTSKLNNFNNNINLIKYLLRSNVNVNVTKTTKANVRLHATMDDYSGPIDSGNTLYRKITQTNPVLYPPYYQPDAANETTPYVLFGNYENGDYLNPYADMVKGYRDTKTSLMLAQFELSQDLGMITDGLKLRAMFNTNRRSEYGIRRSYNPYYFTATNYDPLKDTYILNALNPNSGTDYLTTSEDRKNVITNTYFETALNYDQTFNEKHGVSGMLVYTMRDELTSVDANNLQRSLPARNIGLAGRFTYAYDDRYFLEANFGYNGSERFAKKERFGFFPSVGLGYIISNEAFWTPELEKTISKLKLKATYGLVGNDAIGSSDERFFYLSEVNMNNSDYSYTWGSMYNYSRNGVSIVRYPNENITWETSKKTNLGLELGLFNKWELQVDVYRDDRYNILMDRSSIPTTMGLSTGIKANVGKAVSKGVDLSLDYNQYFSNNFWMSGRANFTYAHSAYKVYEEPDYSLTPWRSRVGYSLSQQWGYVAERLFVDEKEIQNSPVQTFGDYLGGDIKYKDINGDGQITSIDMVPIGYPTSPEIVYGFGASCGWKGIDASFFFQGLARESFWIDYEKVTPFVDTGDFSQNSQNQLLKIIEENHWSEENRNLYAFWPRLSTTVINNNRQRNTWFMRDGTFLRLKSVELGYSLPKSLINNYHINSLRIYYSGLNLLCFSKFKLWDPEMAGNGFNYPVQRVHNIGINLSF
jgi:TonB-linked SusC/RagA family outer membrane protein